MTDLELTEICARWCNLGDLNITNGFVYYAMPNGWRKFNPLHPTEGWNDLWNLVVPKLVDVDISTKNNMFDILRPVTPSKGVWNTWKDGNLSDLPRAVLELVAELYESQSLYEKCDSDIQENADQLIEGIKTGRLKKRTA
jgi:hypothetical protein